MRSGKRRWDAVSDEVAIRAMRATQFEACDRLFWRVDDGVLNVHVRCSDEFAYAAADCEPITAENIEVFERSIAECEALDWRFQPDGALLFVARVRKEMPLAAVLRDLDPRVRALVEAAVKGPTP